MCILVESEAGALQSRSARDSKTPSCAAPLQRRIPTTDAKEALNVAISSTLHSEFNIYVENTKNGKQTDAAKGKRIRQPPSVTNIQPAANGRGGCLFTELPCCASTVCSQLLDTCLAGRGLDKTAPKLAGRATAPLCDNVALCGRCLCFSWLVRPYFKALLCAAVCSHTLEPGTCGSVTEAQTHKTCGSVTETQTQTGSSGSARARKSW